MFISLKFDVVCLYSNRLWLHHLCIYCSCATEETLCQCSDRPLEITFPRWPYLLPCIFFNELHPRSVLPFFYCQDADDTQWAFLPRFWMFLLNSMYDDSSSAASSNVLLYLHSTNECVHIDATMLPFPPALLITWILHSIAMVSCSSCWFYHQIYSLTEWHIFATPCSSTFLLKHPPCSSMLSAQASSPLKQTHQAWAPFLLKHLQSQNRDRTT